MPRRRILPHLVLETDCENTEEAHVGEGSSAFDQLNSRDENDEEHQSKKRPFRLFRFPWRPTEKQRQDPSQDSSKISPISNDHIIQTGSGATSRSPQTLGLSSLTPESTETVRPDIPISIEETPQKQRQKPFQKLLQTPTDPSKLIKRSGTKILSEPSPKFSFGSLLSRSAGRVQPDTIQTDTFVPNIFQTDTLQPNIVHPDTVQSNTILPDIVPPNIVHLDTTQPDFVNLDPVHLHIAHLSALQTDIVHPDTVQSNIVLPDTDIPNIFHLDIIQPDVENMAAADRLSFLMIEKPHARFAIQEARKDEQEIRKILSKKKTPFPPYSFLELIGKGSYGRVYKV